jgi:hypothetical protein
VRQHSLARQTGDRTGQARALSNLGLAEFQQGRCHRQASVRFREALDLFRDIGERSGQAYNLANLGLVRLGQGNYQQAVGHYRGGQGVVSHAGLLQPIVELTGSNLVLARGGAIFWAVFYLTISIDPTLG